MGIGSVATQIGAVSQQEWSTYLQHFVPYENQLIQYAMDPNQVTQATSQALATQEQANSQATGIQANNLAQMETSLTPEEKAAVDKQRGLSNSLANVQAQNKAKDVTVANQMGVMGSQATGITGAL